MRLVSIAALAQALIGLGSVAHSLPQAAHLLLRLHLVTLGHVLSLFPLSQSYTSWPGRSVVALLLSLDDDSQGAQFRAP